MGEYLFEAQCIGIIPFMLLSQILEIVALHLLFAALGFCQASRSAAARNLELVQGGVDWAGSPSADDVEGLGQPMLGERLQLGMQLMAPAKPPLYEAVSSGQGMACCDLLHYMMHGRPGTDMMNALLEEAPDRMQTLMQMGNSKTVFEAKAIVRDA